MLATSKERHAHRRNGMPSQSNLTELYDEWERNETKREASPEWQIDNLEYDLRSTQWILDKAKSREEYAQNIYAALCNNDFIRNDVWPILTHKTWCVSWRTAGGIVANMREEGDYMDWYCSGILNDLSDEEYHQLSKEQQERYLFIKNNHVPEGTVTDEIREDFLKLGWIVAQE